MGCFLTTAEFIGWVLFHWSYPVRPGLASLLVCGRRKKNGQMGPTGFDQRKRTRPLRNLHAFVSTRAKSASVILRAVRITTAVDVTYCVSKVTCTYLNFIFLWKTLLIHDCTQRHNEPIYTSVTNWGFELVTLQYHFFNFDTISTKCWHNIAISIQYLVSK